MLNAAQTQSCGNQGDERKCDLPDQKRVSERNPALAANRAARLLLQGFRNIGPRAFERGHNSKDEPRGYRDQKGVHKNSGIELSFGEVAGNFRRTEGVEQHDAFTGDRNSRHAAGKSQHNALCQQLTNQPGAAGSQRKTDGHFLLPSSRTR